MNERFVEVIIKDLRLQVIIGINDSEKKEKQDVIINISYKYDAFRAIESDNISFANNYKTITKKVIGFVEKSHFNLLETLAGGIFKIVAENQDLKDLVVSVGKPGALRFCDNVIVKIS